MQYVVKFFSEIAIKSKPVRQRFIRQLQDNLRAGLTEIDPGIELRRGWDKLRAARYQRQLDWYDRYVKGEPRAEPVESPSAARGAR